MIVFYAIPYRQAAGSAAGEFVLSIGVGLALVITGAVLGACERLRAKLVKVAAGLFQMPPEAVDLVDGKIVDATSTNTKVLNEVLDSDEGARYLGEFAIGVNNRVREPMLDTLFDEKIGGSFHLTPGQAYEVADNGNRSSETCAELAARGVDCRRGARETGTVPRVPVTVIQRSFGQIGPGGTRLSTR